jgi:hypothetical protein
MTIQVSWDVIPCHPEKDTTVKISAFLQVMGIITTTLINPSQAQKPHQIENM